jgi:hypothetical protein
MLLIFYVEADCIEEKFTLRVRWSSCLMFITIIYDKSEVNGCLYTSCPVMRYGNGL